MITCLDIKKLKKWNKSITELTHIEKISDEMDFIYLGTKPSFLNKKVDFVLLRFNKTLKDGSFFTIYCSISHPDHLPRKGYIRGKVKNYGFYFTPTDDPNVCILYYMQEIKYKGITEINGTMKSSLIKENINLIKSFREIVLEEDLKINEQKPVLSRSNSEKNIELNEGTDKPPVKRKRSQTTSLHNKKNN